MQCQNCKQESAGLKINGKVFCTNCGEEILVVPQNEPAPIQTPQEAPSNLPTEVTPTPKIISAEGDIYERVIEDEVREINILEAEEEVLDLLAKTASATTKPKEAAPEPAEPKNTPTEKTKTTKKPKIIKAKRSRVTPKQSSGFKVIPGEPDPIKTPELPIPHDDMIEASNEVEKAPEKEPTLEPSPKPHHEETPPVENTENKAQPTNNKRKPKDKKKKSFLVTGIILGVLLVSFAALVIYVNFYGINSKRAVATAEQQTSFNYKKPSYLPAGFEASYLTTGTNQAIEYVYQYAPDKDRQIRVKIEKSELDKNSLFSEIVYPQGGSFSQATVGGIEFWTIGDKKAVFVFENALYQISSTEEISKEEITKIVEGII